MKSISPVQIKLTNNFFFPVLDELQKHSEIHSEVGCPEHKRQVSKQVLIWYTNTRLIFACKRYVKTETVIKRKRTKAKSLAKQLKLNAIPVNNEKEATFSTSKAPKRKAESSSTSSTSNKKLKDCSGNSYKIITSKTNPPSPPGREKTFVRALI